MKLVGQVRHDADDQLKKLLLDPPLSRSILIPMPTYGIIQDRNGGPNRAKINVLPFGGACFKEKMIVRMVPRHLHERFCGKVTFRATDAADY